MYDITNDELAYRLNCKRASRDFSLFRKMINKGYTANWFVDEVNHSLQQFYDDYQAGLRPRLMINTPPQHGKSSAIVDFIAWASGKDKNIRSIYSSFSERLGVRANLKLQKIYDSQVYKDVFVESMINNKNTVTITGKELRNREIIEYAGGGYFRNTTVGGSITGESLDIGIIDDAVKGRSEANSRTVREKTWDWFTDDFLSRFSKKGALLIIMTRWHIDDLGGRLINHDKTLKVLTYKAIAENDEPNRKKGEALFEQLKPLKFLIETKNTMDAKGSIGWASLYQQSPFIAGGEIIKREWFKYYDVLPWLKYRYIFADTAMKTGTYNDYSVFQCWGFIDGKMYLVDQIRCKFEAPVLKRGAVQFYQKHNQNLRGMIVEDKASGTGLIQELKRDGLAIKGIGRTTDKLTRVLDVLGYIEAGYLYLPKSEPWVHDYIAEMEQFSSDNGHDHDDQIDPTIDAINQILITETRNNRFSEGF
jgi:predicted phage terminase large subunit-like protein